LPSLTKEQLLEKRGDLSPYLIHLTRTGQWKRWKDVHNLPQDDFQTIDAKQALERVLQNRKIEARTPYGYFNFKVPYQRGTRTLNPNSQVQRSWLRAVCFTETPIDHVYLQTLDIQGRQLHFQPYGLAFAESTIRAKGGNPITYVDTTNANVRLSLDSIPTSSICQNMRHLMPFIEGFGPPWFQPPSSPSEIDFRWEREWRIAGDFTFEAQQIAYGICPTSETGYFEALTGNTIPFVDPTQHIELVKMKLRSYPKLANLK
jgi:hypothetical protein